MSGKKWVLLAAVVLFCIQLACIWLLIATNSKQAREMNLYIEQQAQRIERVEKLLDSQEESTAQDTTPLSCHGACDRE